MKIQELLEAVGGDIIYHSVRSGKTAQQILKSGVIEPFVGDEDEQFFNQELPVISASRSQYYRFPYGDGIVQFVLDRSALKKAGFKLKELEYLLKPLLLKEFRLIQKLRQQSRS